MSWKSLLNPWGEASRLRTELSRVESQVKLLRNKALEEVLTKERINFPIGTHVFTVYNHPSEIFDGEVVGYEAITRSKQLVCKVQNSQGEVRICLSVHRSNPDILRVLRSLPWWERCNIVDPWIFISKKAAAILETYGSHSPDPEASQIEWPEDWKEYTGERASDSVKLELNTLDKMRKSAD